MPYKNVLIINIIINFQSQYSRRQSLNRHWSVLLDQTPDYLINQGRGIIQGIIGLTVTFQARKTTQCPGWPDLTFFEPCFQSSFLQDLWFPAPFLIFMWDIFVNFVNQICFWLSYVIHCRCQEVSSDEGHMECSKQLLCKILLLSTFSWVIWTIM